MILSLIAVTSLDVKCSFSLPKLWEGERDHIARELKSESHVRLNERVSFNFEAAQGSTTEVSAMVSATKKLPSHKFEEAKPKGEWTVVSFTKWFKPKGSTTTQLSGVGSMVFSKTKFVYTQVLFRVKPSQAEIAAAKEVAISIKL